MLFAWGAGEALVRFVIPTSTVAYRFDPEVGYLLQPNGSFRWVSPDYDVQVRTNGAGFHDVEHLVAKPPGVYRVVVVGDSMVEALQVPVHQAFTRLLEERVRGWAGRPVEVINLGVSGKGPAQYHRTLEKVGLAYRPDLVVVAVTLLNDFLNDVPELERDGTKPYYRLVTDDRLELVPPGSDSPAARRREEKVRIGTWVKTALRRSAFVRSFLDRLARWRAGRHGGSSGATATLPVRSEWNVFRAAPPPPGDEAYRLTLRILEESAALARDRGARLLIVVIPPKAIVEDKLDAALRAEGYDGADGLGFDPERPTRAIVHLGATKRIPVLDLGPVLRDDWKKSGESASWPHDGHWSPRGHRLAADALDAWLRAHADDLGLAAQY
jgi:hypothetical protein